MASWERKATKTEGQLSMKLYRCKCFTHLHLLGLKDMVQRGPHLYEPGRRADMEEQLLLCLTWTVQTLYAKLRSDHLTLYMLISLGMIQKNKLFYASP